MASLMVYRMPIHGCAATDADRPLTVIDDGMVPVEYVALLYWFTGRLKLITALAGAADSTAAADDVVSIVA